MKRQNDRFGMWWLLLLLVPGAFGAHVTGTIYAPDLSRINDSILRVNTTPEQVMVLTNGSYALDLAPGSYLVSVESGNRSDVQRFSVAGNGSFVRDFILLPQLDVPTAPDLGPILTPQGGREPLAWLIPSVAVAIVALVLAGFLFARTKRSKRDYDEYERAIIEALIKRGGRATQKEIRSEVPFSEAKASLVISDLASRGLVRKFKRGRGNIVVLQDGSNDEAAKDETNEQEPEENGSQLREDRV